MGLIVRINVDTQWRKLPVVNFSKKCCRHATRCRQAFSDAAKELRTHATHAAGSGEPVMVNVGSTGALEWPQTPVPAPIGLSLNTVQFSTHYDQI
jgi:hypothetical protein